MMNASTLTIFTPTYNRGYCISKCYESLCRQTVKDFVWLIIDDGSTDGTGEMVDSWKNEKNGFEIIYIYQTNQGIHIAHNTAYKMIDTELCVCIDSDDFMPENAVENIIEYWRQFSDDSVAGIMALNTYTDGTVIGDVLPRDRKRTTVFEVSHILKNNGTKKIVYRSALIKQNPYPRYYNEKFYPLEYKYYLIDQKYKLLIMHDPICRVEPMPDSIANFIMNEQFKSPHGFLEWYLFLLSLPMTTKTFKFQQNIYYVCSCIINREAKWLKKSPCRLLTLLSSPAGLCRYIYLIFKTGYYEKGKKSRLKGLEKSEI